jgi:hypothetical protein
VTASSPAGGHHGLKSGGNRFHGVVGHSGQLIRLLTDRFEGFCAVDDAFHTADHVTEGARRVFNPFDDAAGGGGLFLGAGTSHPATGSCFT